MSTLSSPIPARPTTTRSDPASNTSAVTCVAERMISALRAGHRLQQFVGREVQGDVDIMAGRGQPIEAARGQGFGYQHT